MSCVVSYTYSLLVAIIIGLVLLTSYTNCENNNKHAANTTIEQHSRLPVAANRIRDEPESVWVEFIQLALDHKPLNLGQGFPDFAAPEYLVESLQNATKQTTPQVNVLNHQYTRSFGHPRLVRAIRDYYKLLRDSNLLIDEKSQVLVTVGAYEALFAAIMGFVNPGDEVIIIDPAFDAYAPMVAMAGGSSVFVPLRLDSAVAGAFGSNNNNNNNNNNISSANYKLDLNELKSKISLNTRALVLNTPNNPMGKIYSRRELAELADLCRLHNLLVIADEVYEQFYYDNNEHVSIASLPGMWERTITIGSAGKTFSVTGWKIGWAYGPSHLIRYMQLIHQTAVYTVATPLQEALAAALEHEIGQVMRVANIGLDVLGKQQLTYWSQLRNDLTRKRNRMARVLERAQMRPVLPEGGYFMLADFSNLANLFPEYNGQAGQGDKTKNNTINTNDYKFARWLSRVKHLQGIPGGAFYSEANKLLGKDLIRLCFIKSDQTLDKFEKLIDELVRTSPNKSQ